MAGLKTTQNFRWQPKCVYSRVGGHLHAHCYAVYMHLIVVASCWLSSSGFQPLTNYILGPQRASDFDQDPEFWFWASSFCSTVLHGEYSRCETRWLSCLSLTCVVALSGPYYDPELSVLMQLSSFLSSMYHLVVRVIVSVHWSLSHITPLCAAVKVGDMRHNRFMIGLRESVKTSHHDLFFWSIDLLWTTTKTTSSMSFPDVPIITPAPLSHIIRRQQSNEQCSAEASRSATEAIRQASQSASQQIQQATISASNAIRDAQNSASQSVAAASRSSSSISSSAASAMASVISSAERAVLSAQVRWMVVIHGVLKVDKY